jgi:hypothetical protein
MIVAVDHQTVVIRLELQLADGSLTGRASDGAGAGAAREFTGWMGLVAAIDALLGGRSSEPEARDSTGAVEEGEAS